MTLDLKEILNGARVVAHQAESVERLSDEQYDAIVSHVIALGTLLEKKAPIKALRDKARYIRTSAEEMVRN